MDHRPLPLDGNEDAGRKVSGAVIISAESRETEPAEWEGDTHILIVHSVRVPDGPFDDGGLEYDLEHPAACRQEERGTPGRPYLAWACAVAQNESDCGLPFALRYSGTPVTAPGTYRIRAWGRRYYAYAYEAYEYDGGVYVTEEG